MRSGTRCKGLRAGGLRIFSISKTILPLMKTISCTVRKDRIGLNGQWWTLSLRITVNVSWNLFLLYLNMRFSIVFSRITLKDNVFCRRSNWIYIELGSMKCYTSKKVQVQVSIKWKIKLSVIFLKLIVQAKKRTSPSIWNNLPQSVSSWTYFQLLKGLSK
jgi:hypothetical protein